MIPTWLDKGREPAALRGMSTIAPARLLIVDDEISTIRVLSTILQEFGEVFFATNGADALAMIPDRQPDLIMLDAQMAGMDGFAVCAAIKSDPAHADLPILFITAHNDIATETHALELGAVDFITKPPSPAIVRARVKTHLTLKQRTDELHRLASVDSLTGIANRRAFDAALDLEWRRVSRSKAALSLLLVDVDCFKRFNDHYGHQAGDDCLRAVASALDAGVRRPAETAARYGGEEFAVILPACDQDTAMTLAEKLRTNVATLHIPHAASEVSDSVTISIGVASLTKEAIAAGQERPESSVLSLITAADKGLYEAKRTGRNRVACAPPSPMDSTRPL